MDPNEALVAIRQAVDGLRDAENSPAVSRTQVVALVEHVQALDEWLSKGGFLPAPWNGSGRPLPFPIEPLGPPNPAHGELPHE